MCVYMCMHIYVYTCVCVHTYVYVCVRVCVCVPVPQQQMWKSKDNLLKLVHTSYHMGSENQTQVVQLRAEHLHL